MIGKKCLKSLLMFGGIMSVLAFGKTALADEVPVIKGDDGKYDISCIVQAPEGSKWITHYYPRLNACTFEFFCRSFGSRYRIIRILSGPFLKSGQVPAAIDWRKGFVLFFSKARFAADDHGIFFTHALFELVQCLVVLIV